MADSTADDFDRLGAAVARVLRDAFSAAEDMRRAGAADAGALAAQVGGEIERTLRDALGVQSRVRRDAEDVAASVRSTTASAQRAVDEVLAGARRDAAQLQESAAERASALVATARDTVDQARAAMEAQHLAFERDLGRLVSELQNAVDSLRDDTVARRRVALERANAEAAAILRQARMHHRATAAEVDRMIEAAAGEAAELRRTAREDALRITEQVAAVVEIGGAPQTPHTPAPPPREPRAGRRRAS